MKMGKKWSVMIGRMTNIMKTKILFITSLLLIIGCSKPVEESTLINKDGLMFLPDSDKPYTGEVFTNYSTGEKLYQGTYENGLLIEYSYLKKDGSVKTPINDETLIEKDELIYDPNYDEPYNGEVVMYYDTGEKEYQGTYENGLLIEYSYLNKDGTVKEPVNGETLIDRGGLSYEVNGQKPYTGDVFELYKDGSRKYTGSIKGGRVNGLLTSWYENGQKEFEGVFKDGKKDGVHKGWYENGEKKGEGTYKDGKLDGLFTSWYEFGNKDSEKTYNNGELTVWTEYNGNIKLRETNYKGGEKNGLMTYWDHKSGQKIGEITYKNGKMDGKWTEWYENGNVEKEGVYIVDDNDDDNNDGWGDDLNDLDDEIKILNNWWSENGEIIVENGNGTWTFWYNNGNKYSEGTYIDGRLTGKVTYWYEHGQKSEEQFYEKGEKTGRWTEWESWERDDDWYYRRIPYKTITSYNKNDMNRYGEYPVWNFWCIYHKNTGKKKEQGISLYDKRFGKWTYFKSDGTFYREEDGWNFTSGLYMSIDSKELEEYSKRIREMIRKKSQE